MSEPMWARCGQTGELGGKVRFGLKGGSEHIKKVATHWGARFVWAVQDSQNEEKKNWPLIEGVAETVVARFVWARDVNREKICLLSSSSSGEWKGGQVSHGKKGT